MQKQCIAANLKFGYGKIKNKKIIRLILIDMNISVSVGRRGFECVEIHYSILSVAKPKKFSREG